MVQVRLISAQHIHDLSSGAMARWSRGANQTQKRAPQDMMGVHDTVPASTPCDGVGGVDVGEGGNQHAPRCSDTCPWPRIGCTHALTQGLGDSARAQSHRDEDAEIVGGGRERRRAAVLCRRWLGRQRVAPLCDLHDLAKALLVVEPDEHHGDCARCLHVHDLGREGAPAPLHHHDLATQRMRIRERPACVRRAKRVKGQVPRTLGSAPVLVDAN